MISSFFFTKIYVSFSKIFLKYLLYYKFDEITEKFDYFITKIIIITKFNYVFNDITKLRVYI